MRVKNISGKQMLSLLVSHLPLSNLSLDLPNSTNLNLVKPTMSLTQHMK